MEVKVVINNKCDITKKEKDVLIEAYRKLYASIYGNDLVDVFLKVSNLGTNEARKKDVLKEYSYNYTSVLDIFNDIDKLNNIKLFTIYDNNKLIGGGRIIINSSEAIIPEIVFINLSKEDERNIWKYSIMFLENYLKSKKYKKMYIEIPYYEGPLLIRANELGFIEDPLDIPEGIDYKKYILNKDLG